MAMLGKKHEFKPDRMESGPLHKLYITRKQRLKLLKWLMHALVLLVVCLIQGTGLLASGANPVIVGFLLALFSTILGHTIFSWALKFYTPSFVSACKLLEPVGAGILAVFLFGEIPAPAALLGGALILFGVRYYAKIEQKA